MDVLAHLEQHQRKQLLRFVAVGSVDDGKSTLIGRLLHDTQGIYDDQLEAVKAASKHSGSAKGEIDFALLTDGLKAEREQGITIDVAYRYFATDKRKFIIADTPGHVQYTRNMATGASTADVAIILIDCNNGVLQQSRRHAYIASLLGIPSLAVCVNKMDLIGFDQQRFEAITAEFRAFAEQLDFERVVFFPVSAVDGDNVVEPSARTPWYRPLLDAGEHGGSGDGTLLSFLETVPLPGARGDEPFRYPVQYVLRPSSDYRGFAGRVASGVVRCGDPVMVVPSGRASTVKAIDTYEGEVEEAFAPMSVSLRLADEVDVSRGDMLVGHQAGSQPPAEQQPAPVHARRVEAHLIWMSETPLDPSRGYFLKHTTRSVRATVQRVLGRVDLQTLEQELVQTLALNDIGRVVIGCNQPLFCEPYRKSRQLGSFIIIDALSNNTVAAGMIIAALGDTSQDGSRLPDSAVEEQARRARLGHGAAVVALSGAAEGERALAYALEARLFELGCVVTVIDVDDVADATRSPALLADIATQCVGLGAIAIFSRTLPRPADRSELKRRLGADHVHTFALAGAAVAEPAARRLSKGIEAAVDGVVAALRDAGVLAAVQK